MLESIILGIVQGIVEWLPISSEGAIFLIMSNLFNTTNVLEITKIALFLHFGTFLAALIYFRKDVIEIIKNLFSYSKAKEEDKKLIHFLIITTLISGILGFVFILVFSSIFTSLYSAAKILTLLIGILLFVTGIIQIVVKKTGARTLKDIGFFDSVLLGLGQAFAVMPGLSRSGTTISLLLLRKVDETLALKLSFLMSLPIVLAGNIFLNLDMFVFSLENFIALLFSFTFGLLTIHLLLKLSRKINFGYFAFLFGFLMVASVMI